MQKRQLTIEDDFLNLMEEIDAELQKESVPIHARSIQAISKIAPLIQEDLPITSERKTPVKGIYSGIDLSIRISRWYKDRYGERMKVNPSSYIAIMIREDVYKLRLPYFAGSLELICRPELIGAELGPRIRNDGKPVRVNVLNHVEGLTKNYAESLLDEELWEVPNRFLMGLHAVELIREGAKHFSLLPEASGNIANSVELMFSTPPQYGFSKWESLQATEKVLKAFISAKGAKFRFTHILDDLALSAELLGLPLIPRAELNDIQCSPQIRYGTVAVSPREAVTAHQAALSVCGGISVALIKLKGITPPVQMR